MRAQVQAFTMVAAFMACHVIDSTHAADLPDSRELIPTGLERNIPPTAMSSLRFDTTAPTFLSGGSITLLGEPTSYFDEGSLGELVATIHDFGGLQPNWDGEGAAAPTSAAIEHTLAMVSAVPPQIGLPHVMIMGSGDIALYWESGDIYAEIGFDGTGTYYAYASAPGRKPVHIDDEPVCDASGAAVFPDSVRDMLI
jgi:hypothetical protein